MLRKNTLVQNLYLGVPLFLLGTVGSKTIPGHGSRDGPTMKNNFYGRLVLQTPLKMSYIFKGNWYYGVPLEIEASLVGNENTNCH